MLLKLGHIRGSHLGALTILDPVQTLVSSVSNAGWALGFSKATRSDSKVQPGLRTTETETERQRQRDRQTEKQRERERQKEINIRLKWTWWEDSRGANRRERTWRNKGWKMGRQKSEVREECLKGEESEMKEAYGTHSGLAGHHKSLSEGPYFLACMVTALTPTPL